ncbi:Quinol oxidase subunit I QxtA [Pseudooceanicola batsensis HTCC2597]|uniref:Quinol oxidase subunit I QxtA n=1 Tax=Pseudooceanicola batsensis (strain ATCC BAA-863 / DSM 15984 / KCTC 12145 / HTCC2597) TaxID=252305 RepID=A3TXK0_PSEBH|nr:cytochrome ubiquinol oxidase subunit I [Pseudooceanicola batsensis]EAQ03560.1 Quinol oxidase subunit I QxtA [Pseudooceanicola batsensis HTCC2597]
MFDFTALELARFQFAFTVAFHIIFPAFSIGLASFLAVLNALHYATGRDVFIRLFDFWKTIFAVAFGMGVVSGIVMSYQFGTNWSVFSDKTGPVLGPMMGYEVLSAFFLEAGFLGVMLFGRSRVGPGLHLLATLMVAIGTLGSAFWILSVNSWMQTPVGFAMNDQGQFVPTDWWAIVFNPSFPYRFVHMVLAAYLTTALVVGGVGGWHLLRDSRDAAARVMFGMAMGMLVVTAPLQILAGDLHGLNTLEHQPAKIAAMEGHYDGHPEGGAPLILFGIPDDETGTVRYAVEIPYLSNIILTHDLTSPLPGLRDFPPDERPSAELIFWTFRVMAGLGFAMLGLGLWGAVAWWRGRLFDSPVLHRAAIAMGPMGFVAVLCGWITTEVGRQPWTVYGLLKTQDSVSPVELSAVSSSLMAFIVVYFVIFGIGTYYLFRLMGHPPEGGDPEPVHGPTRAAGVTPGPAEDVDADGEMEA